MQTAETVLHIIRQRGINGLPLQRIYRQLFNRDLYLLAYSRLYRNRGSMTPGATAETVDGMSVAKIDAIIDLVRAERYRWTPVRRVEIPKPRSTKRRPLGLPTWSDKLLQEVIRLILDAYYDPQFSDHAHGFRAQRGCHTALSDIRHTWTGTTWFIEGDIARCFDSLDHDILLTLLSERIQDQRFLRLIRGLLTAGYLEQWTYQRTLSGVPQGSILGPLLSNIYLDRLDRFVETTLLPTYNRGTRRRPNPAYLRVTGRIGYLRRIGQSTSAEAQRLRALRRTLPSVDPSDPQYRRLRYVRYADDFLLGFSGPREEAVVIKEQLRAFLHSTLKLELSETKTLITHARTTAARFLGYEVTVYHANAKVDTTGRRNINGCIGLRVPARTIAEKCHPYMRHGKPVHRSVLSQNTVFSIIAQYQAEYRGIVEYYRLAYNLVHLHRLKWIMEQSLAKTLAMKLRITVSQVFARYQTTIEVDGQPRPVLQDVIERPGKPPLIAQWGGISLRWQPDVILNDTPRRLWNDLRSEIVQRLLRDECELCGAKGPCETHHIRALKDLHRKGQRERRYWVKLMAARRRKTLVVCPTCHWNIHRGYGYDLHHRT